MKKLKYALGYVDGEKMNIVKELTDLEYKEYQDSASFLSSFSASQQLIKIVGGPAGI